METQPVHNTTLNSKSQNSIPPTDLKQKDYLSINPKAQPASPELASTTAFMNSTDSEAKKVSNNNTTLNELDNDINAEFGDLNFSDIKNSSDSDYQKYNRFSKGFYFKPNTKDISSMSDLPSQIKANSPLSANSASTSNSFSFESSLRSNIAELNSSTRKGSIGFFMNKIPPPKNPPPQKGPPLSVSNAQFKSFAPPLNSILPPRKPPPPLTSPPLVRTRIHSLAIPSTEPTTIRKIPSPTDLSIKGGDSSIKTGRISRSHSINDTSKSKASENSSGSVDAPNSANLSETNTKPKLKPRIKDKAKSKPKITGTAFAFDESPGSNPSQTSGNSPTFQSKSPFAGMPVGESGNESSTSPKLPPIKPVVNSRLLNILKSKNKKSAGDLNTQGSQNITPENPSMPTPSKDDGSDLSDSTSIIDDVYLKKSIKEQASNALKSITTTGPGANYQNYENVLGNKRRPSSKHDSIESNTDVDLSHRDSHSENSARSSFSSKRKQSIMLESNNTANHDNKGFDLDFSSTYPQNERESEFYASNKGILNADLSNQDSENNDQTISEPNIRSRLSLKSSILKQSEFVNKDEMEESGGIRQRESSNTSAISFLESNNNLPSEFIDGLDLGVAENGSTVSEGQVVVNKAEPVIENSYLSNIILNQAHLDSNISKSLLSPTSEMDLFSKQRGSEPISKTTNAGMPNSAFGRIDGRNDDIDLGEVRENTETVDVPENPTKIDPLALSPVEYYSETELIMNPRSKHSSPANILTSNLKARLKFDETKRINYITRSSEKQKFRIRVLFLNVDSKIRHVSLLKPPTVQIFRHLFYANFPELNLKEEMVDKSNRPRLMIWNGNLGIFIDYFEGMDIGEFSVIKWVSDQHPLTHKFLSKEPKPEPKDPESLDLLKSEIQSMKKQLIDLPAQILKAIGSQSNFERSLNLSETAPSPTNAINNAPPSDNNLVYELNSQLKEMGMKNSSLSENLEKAEKSNKALRLQITSLRKKQQQGQEYFESTNESLKNEMAKLKEELAKTKKDMAELEASKSHGLVDTEFINDRENILTGKDMIKTEYNNLGHKMEDIEILINELRKDVIMRGSTPKPELLELAKKELSDIESRGKVLNHFIENTTTEWKRIWERELQNIVSEQKLVKHVLGELGELLKDAGVLGELLSKIVSAISYKMSNKSGTPSGNDLSLVFGHANQEDLPDLKGHILDEITGIQVDHNARLDAIDQLERVRQFNTLLPKSDFESELSAFVQGGNLKSAGGLDALEKARKEKDYQNMIEMLRNSQRDDDT